MNFNAMKTNFTLEKMNESVKKMTDVKKSYQEENDKFWQPTVDKTGTGSAIIRFLPPSADDTDPWIKLYSHGFESNGGWYIENCPTTIGAQCPVCEHNNTLWTSGIDANKEIVRNQKRRLTYIANILVISDPKNPENEGQVKLFKFGKKIFEKIMDASNPKFEDQEPINPLDFWNGANFRLRICKVDGYRNYDKSSFDSPSALFNGDDVLLEELWKKQHCLKNLVGLDKFKIYAELQERFNRVMGVAINSKVTDVDYEISEETTHYEAPAPEYETPAAPTPKYEAPRYEQPAFTPPSAPTVSVNTKTGDDELDEFASLLDD